MGLKKGGRVGTVTTIAKAIDVHSKLELDGTLMIKYSVASAAPTDIIVSVSTKTLAAAMTGWTQFPATSAVLTMTTQALPGTYLPICPTRYARSTFPNDAFC
jgi:hypothetical protein